MFSADEFPSDQRLQSASLDTQGAAIIFSLSRPEKRRNPEPLRFIHAIRTVLYVACGLFGFVALPAGCGCRVPEVALPPIGAKKYAEIERRIEQTVHPQIIFFAENLEEQPTEIHVLVALGYFRRTLSGVVPTASGRKVAVVDRWPMPKKPGRPYGDHDYISFQAGSYAVQKLTSAAEYPGGICVLAVFPTGCGCRSPERQLPSTDDPQYAKIERLIERTLHPYITLKAVSAKGSSAELRELVRLGYLRRAREVYFPTAYARKVAVYDTWPTEIGGPFHLKYEGGESIAFAIGTYSVSRLASAAHIDGAPCGAFDDERDEYGFVGTVKLNALGRSLFREHLLYTKVGRAGLLQLWDGRRPVNDIWSNSDTGGNDDHKDVRSGGNTVNLRSTLS